MSDSSSDGSDPDPVVVETFVMDEELGRIGASMELHAMDTSRELDVGSHDRKLKVLRLKAVLIPSMLVALIGLIMLSVQVLTQLFWEDIKVETVMEVFAVNCVVYLLGAVLTPMILVVAVFRC